MKSYPLQKKGGRRKSFSHAVGGGGTQSFEVVFTWELEVLAILNWGGGALKAFSPLKGGGSKKFYPVLSGRGGGRAQNVLDPRFPVFSVCVGVSVSVAVCAYI